MTAQRAKSTAYVFHAGNDFEVRAEDGGIFLTGYGWSSPEALTVRDAEFAAAVITAARCFVEKGPKQ